MYAIHMLEKKMIKSMVKKTVMVEKPNFLYLVSSLAMCYNSLSVHQKVW